MAEASGKVDRPGRRRRWALALLALAVSTTGTLVVLEIAAADRGREPVTARAVKGFKA
jgi:hypothetical protein